jgi:hypothetical protein
VPATFARFGGVLGVTLHQCVGWYRRDPAYDDTFGGIWQEFGVERAVDPTPRAVAGELTSPTEAGYLRIDNVYFRGALLTRPGAAWCDVA